MRVLKRKTNEIHDVGFLLLIFNKMKISIV